MRSETTNVSDWVPINVAARMLGISGPAIRNWVRQGRLEVRVQTEDTPRIGTEYKFIKHVSLKEVSRIYNLRRRIHERNSCLPRAHAK